MIRFSNRVKSLKPNTAFLFLRFELSFKLLKPAPIESRFGTCEFRGRGYEPQATAVGAIDGVSLWNLRGFLLNHLDRIAFVIFYDSPRGKLLFRPVHPNNDGVSLSLDSIMKSQLIQLFPLIFFHVSLYFRFLYMYGTQTTSFICIRHGFCAE